MRLIYFVFLICFASFLSGQMIKNRVIVEVDDNQLDYVGEATKITKLTEDGKYWVLEFDENQTQNDLTNLSKSIDSKVHFDYQLEERLSPNDPSVGTQWYIEFLKLPRVWELTTGGKTHGGREIVIAILDTGIQLDHPDLKDNIYVNKGEIANNGRDDDNNGYIDDVSGINANSGIGSNHVVTRHGTWVAGIAGAKGNNGIGVTGVNWNVKILPITGITTVSDIIKGYDYIKNIKAQYNASNGTKGAFIVATNYSGGLAKKFGTDPAFKPWCDLYDALGNEGVISVGSTVNSAFNVDVEGDLPSTCPSQYLITVTNLTREATLEAEAGYGKINVDLAAPGDDVYNLGSNSSYFQDVGTSASAPIVAGMIGLLYSVPCPSFENQIKNNYVGAAKTVRDAILKGVIPSTTLKERTSSGGYLDAMAALGKMQTICDNKLLLPAKKGDLAIEAVYANGDNLTLRYLTQDEAPSTLLFFNLSGKLIYEYDFTPPQFGEKEVLISNFNFPSGVYYTQLISGTQKVGKGFYKI